jgi:hypothetical protein
VFSDDIFVTEFSPDGAYVWTRTFGGTGYDEATGVVLDMDGEIFVTGSFRGRVDFDPTDGVDQHVMVPPYKDIFITKLHPDGSYAWTRTYDAHYPSGGGGIAVDGVGGAVIASVFSGTVDFDPTEGFDWRSSVDGTSDIFVTKVNSDGSYAWTYAVGGPGINDVGQDVAVDALGNVIATGLFCGTVDFDPGPGSDVHVAVRWEDVFVTMLGPDGSYEWTRTFGGLNTEYAKYVAVDRFGNVIVSGVHWAFEGMLPDCDPGCEVAEHGPHFEGASDAFITKLICVQLTVDVDHDGDVDLFDYARFQACFTGDGTVVCGTGCTRLDLDRDDDIDLADYFFIADLLEPPAP